MYSKIEAAERRKEFWETFGEYMRKHPVKSNSKSSWLTYKTRVRDIYFRFEVDNRGAKVCIDIQHRDKEIRDLYYEQFTELKVVLESIMGMEFIWSPSYILEETDKEVCRIYTELHYKNINRKEDWEDLFQFLEKHIVPLDKFWEEYADIFIELGK
jgi:hypothetical protein